MSKYLLACCLFFAFITLRAATITSTAGGGNWNSTSTWVGNIIPGSADAVVINGPVTLDVSPTVVSVTINSGATLSLATFTLSLSGTGAGFTNNGTLNAGTGTVDLTGSKAATISGSTATTFYNLTISDSKGATISLGSGTQSVSNNLTLSGDVLTTNGLLSLPTTATVVVSSTKGAFSATPTGSGWNVSYSVNFTTGSGFETTTTPTSITCQAGTVKLGTNANVGSGGISVTGGTFDSQTFTLSSSSLSISAGAIFKETSGTFTLTGNLSNSGTYTAAGTLSLAGSSLQTISGSSTTFNNVTVQNSTTSVTATATPLTFGGNFINNGTFTAPSTLNVQGNFTNNLTFTPNSGTVVFNGAGAAAQLISGATTFNSLTINNSKGVTISSGTQTVTNLTLTAGTFATGTHLSMANGGSILVNAATPSVTGTLAGGPWSVTYNPGGNFTTSSEVTATAGFVSTVSCQSGTVKLNTSINVGTGVSAGSTALTISSGATFNPNALTVTLASGNLSVSGTYSTSGTLVFAIPSGSQTISGTAATTTTFNNITVNSGATLTAPSTLNMQGNLIITGTFTAPSATLNLQGALTNNGTYTHNSGTINFTGNTAQAVSGSSATTFYNFTINKNANTVTVNFASATTFIANNLTLTAGTCNITSTTQMTSSSAVITLTAGTLGITSNRLSVTSGTSIIVSAGTIGTSSPNVLTSGGTWSLNYISTGARTTGFEIPVSPSNGALSAVTVSGSGTITLNKTLTITGSGGFTQSAGTFLSSANTISTTNMTLSAGSFIAPSTTLTLTSGDLTITNGVYSDNGGKLIFAGGAQTITGTASTVATTNFNSITINSTATFTAPATLNIAGTLQNDGAFTHNSGTVVFSPGSTTSSIQGNHAITFYNITVTNGAPALDLSLDTSAGASLTNILDIGSSVFDPDGGGTSADGGNVFTLSSTSDSPASDASIATIDVINGGLINGNLTVQRFMKREGDSSDPNYPWQVWRDISAPVSSNVADLQQYLPVTGTFSNADVISGATAGVASMVRYDETTTTDTDGDGIIDLNDGWIDFPDDNGSNTQAFTTGLGYSIFIFGMDSEKGRGNDKWSLHGVPNQGDINLPVTYTDRLTGDNNNNGWNLVGNPYASAIDWNSAGWTKDANIQPALWIDDYSATNPVFVSYVNNVWSKSGYQTSGTAYIASGQGFWVKADGPLGSNPLTITEAVKVNSQTSGFSSPDFFRSSAPANILRVALISSNQLRDETVIYFDELATTGLDRNYDAQKLMNPYGYQNLSSISLNQKYSINGLPLTNSCSQTVALDVSDVVTGTYNLNFSGYSGMPSSMSLLLKDNLTNTTTDIRQTQNYSFNVDQNNPATFGSGRFSISFTYSIAPAITAQTQSVCDPSLAQVTVKNTSIEFNYSIVSSADGSEIVSAVPGTGNDLNFLIPSSNVVAGNNQFQVKAVSKYCETLTSTGNVSFSYVVVPSAPVGTPGQSCGEGMVTLSASGAPTDGHYAWYDALDATTALSDQTASFTTESISKDKTYYVAAVNSLGCEGQRTAITASVVILVQPTITAIDLHTLQSDYDTGNQWYLNNNPIAGATGKTLTVTQSGIYKLVVTSQGCTASTEKQFAVTGIENTSSEIKVYPNPVRSTLSIEVQGGEAASGALYNVMGESLNSISFTNDGTKQYGVYKFTGESSGVYFVKINQGSKVAVVRIVKE